MVNINLESTRRYEVWIFAFLQAVRNPYLFRVGDIGVHVTFSGKNGDTLQKRVCNLLSKSI